MSGYRLLSVSADSKTPKGEAFGWLTGALYLAPYDLSGRNVCSASTPECRDLCIYHQGRAAVFQTIPAARLRRTAQYWEDRSGFLRDLDHDLRMLRRAAGRMRKRACVRLNATSDLDWSEVITANPDLTFYDYSKRPNVIRRFSAGRLPPNYDVTFSRSETNAWHVGRALAAGLRVAVVFRKDLPRRWSGYPVVNGDRHDLRFLDPGGVVVGLRAKGTARKSRSGFVVDYERALA